MKTFVIFSFLFAYSILAKNTYDTRYIDVPLDHFSFTTNLTFKLKYLVNDTFHVRNGPVFFYTGNEGEIEVFAENTGFIYDIAPQFNALIVFAEHRYYGESLPFGNLSYSSPQYLGYLSSTQALADFVYLINNLQKTHGINSRHLEKLPIVAFGGSYGGMLSAWLRMKYPASVVGSIAASAPIWQFKGLTPCANFYRIVTNVYEGLGGSKCSNTIKKSWSVIRSLTSTNAGKANLSAIWNLCSVPKTASDIDEIVDWLTNIYTNLAMVNYPYPTSFLVPLPGNPVREFCSKIVSYVYKDNIGLLKAIGEALNVYTNYTKTAKCNDVTKADDLGDKGWDFQSCTEMIIPLSSTDMDMFENQEWDFKKFSDKCFKEFGVRPRNEEIPILEYGGKELSSASNIVFSNGLLDPWSSGGVLSNITRKVVAVVIPDGAHHFDLRSANPLDTESVKVARQFHVHEIKRWLDKYYLENLKIKSNTSDKC